MECFNSKKIRTKVQKNAKIVFQSTLVIYTFKYMYKYSNVNKIKSFTKKSRYSRIFLPNELKYWY